MMLVCFCNPWCYACTNFRKKFDTIDWVDVRKHWIDVEGDSILWNGVEINEVPSFLLVSDDGETSFFSKLPPRVEQIKIVVDHINKVNFPKKRPDFDEGNLAQKVFK